RFFADDASRDRFWGLITSFPSNPVLIVFFGHGVPGALLTSASLGDKSRDYENRHGTLLAFDDDIPQNVTLHVVGFCCSAALKLGVSLRERNHRFLGFSSNLYFVFGWPYEDAFRRPISRALRQIITTRGNVGEESWRTLLDEYTTEYNKWTFGE